ncbi:MAG: 1-acyl-sn-glycerol-3-phosphate acyltransferase [Dysgonamonadaceae bacterium]|jgi:1-acyl-sn-glycerol-3-phosphate acyltransferase|nr:1-acyl-sn-glycerol-3-phosphate acyltransferase [Dysgonamonadaceae bacterium]
MKKFYSILFKALGWSSSIKKEDVLPKCIICVAPHTSNWDFIIGMLFYKSIGGKPHVLMKKSWFFFPLNYLLRGFGGIPVDRKKKSLLTGQMAGEFRKRNHFQLAIAPEGTRGKTSEWKSGFYYIAREAAVPITLAYLDYTKKRIGIFENFVPSGNLTGDMCKIKQFYKNISGKYPAKFSI